MHRFYASPECFSDNSIDLDQDQTRHLRDVLRMREGASIRVFDGLGREYLCEVSEVSKKRATARIIKEIGPACAESTFGLTLAVAILKGEKFDWVIQKAVELGISRLIPMITARCDVKLKDSSKRVERWRKIALEASKQCGRAKIMRVDEPLSFDDLLSRKVESGKTAFVLFAEREGSSFDSIRQGDTLTALVGPEGGWDDVELQSAKDHNVQIITLGGRILRAETAAIAISALLQNKFGDLN